MAPLEASTPGSKWLSSWDTLGNILMFGESNLRNTPSRCQTHQRESLPAAPSSSGHCGSAQPWAPLLCFPGVHSAPLPGVCAACVGAGHCAPWPVPVWLHCSQCCARFGSASSTQTLSAASCGSEQSQGMQTVPRAAMPQLIACESQCCWKSRCLWRGCQSSVFHQESAWP